MRPLVKFCGMTRAGDIGAAEKLGADFIGFVFVSSSPRSVTLETAVDLRKTVKKAKTVGVFDDSSHGIGTYEEEVRLDFIQLHGTPDIDRIRSFSTPVIQAFRGVPSAHVLENFLEHCSYVLIDKADGEHSVDFDAIAALPSSIRGKLFLAGGLAPNNVRMAVDRIHPFAVDCARGIESQPGIKNSELMRDFFTAIL